MELTGLHDTPFGLCVASKQEQTEAKRLRRGKARPRATNYHPGPLWDSIESVELMCIIYIIFQKKGRLTDLNLYEARIYNLKIFKGYLDISSSSGWVLYRSSIVFSSEKKNRPRSTRQPNLTSYSSRGPQFFKKNATHYYGWWVEDIRRRKSPPEM